MTLLIVVGLGASLVSWHICSDTTFDLVPRLVQGVVNLIQTLKGKVTRHGHVYYR